MPKHSKLSKKQKKEDKDFSLMNDLPFAEKQSKKISKAQNKPKQEKRATRGVKLGNLNENALAKKSAISATEQKKDKLGGNELEGAFIRKRLMGKRGGKSQKEIDKELRKQYDKGKAYDEDEDDVADRKNQREQNEDDQFEAILRDYNNQPKNKGLQGKKRGSGGQGPS